MSSALQQSDVVRLMQQPSPQVRAIVASKLALVMEKPGLTDNELELAKDIIRKMAADVEVVVRLAVSKNLRNSRHLPHDIAVKLANDIEAIALPILTDSEILTDDDLIEILSASDTVKQKAIASRPHVSEKLSDAIVTTASEVTVAVLMGNKGAQIAEHSFDKAVERFASSELVKEKMVMREKLPAAVVERLAVMVSEKLQNQLVERHKVSPALAEELAIRSREMAVIRMEIYASPEDAQRLVREMNRKMRLTPSIILRALCLGNLTFFECAMAELAHIPIVNASTLIRDQGRKGVESLWEKASLPANYLPVVYIALNVRQDLVLNGNEDDIKRYRVTIIEQILAQASTMNDKDVEFFLDLIRM